jgi:uncharacterized membrane protein (UPF0127 family)
MKVESVQEKRQWRAGDKKLESMADKGTYIFSIKRKHYKLLWHTKKHLWLHIQIIDRNERNKMETVGNS